MFNIFETFIFFLLRRQRSYRSWFSRHILAPTSSTHSPLSPPSTICIFFYYAPRPDSRILPTFFGKTLEISRDWRVPGLSGYHSLRFDCKNISFFFSSWPSYIGGYILYVFFLWMIYRFTMGILFCESCPLIVIWAHSL